MPQTHTRRPDHHHASGRSHRRPNREPRSHAAPFGGHALTGARAHELRRQAKTRETSATDAAAQAKLFAEAAVLAISARGATVRPLSLDNTTVGHPRNWSPALAESPYVVHLAHRGRFVTVALDFDAKLGEPGDAARHADIVYDLLTEARFPAVVARSGPTEGRHVYLPVGGFGIELHTARNLVHRLIALGLTTLDPSCMSNIEECIRPLGAPHRTGGVSEPLCGWPQALDRLRRDRPDTPRTQDVVEFVDALTTAGEMRLGLRGRGDDAVATSVTSTTSKRYKSRSEHLQALATQVVATGGDQAAFESLLAALDRDHPVAQLLASETHAQRARSIMKSFKKATEFVQANPSVHQGSHDDAAVIEAWEEYDFAMLGGTKSAVLVVLLNAARASGSKLVGMSTRRLAELAAMKEPTARRALRAAVEDGFLEVAGTGSGVKAARYRLRHPVAWDAAVADAVGPSSVRGGVRLPTASTTAANDAERLGRDVGAELWFPDALGPHVRTVYLVLARLSAAGDPIPTAALAQALGKSPRQVRHDLGRLRDVGLVRNLGRQSGWVAEARDVEVIVEELGVTGIAEEQRRRHARERQANAIKIIKNRLRRKFGEVPVVSQTVDPVRNPHPGHSNRGHCPAERGRRKPARSSASFCLSRRARSSTVGSRHTISTL